MIHSVRFTCVLDTNVIYPINTRDILFWFAHYNLYTAKWSEGIFDEWKSVMERKGITKEEIEKRIAKATGAFPDALVTNYKPLIATLELPDEKDRHVLAAAIKVNANIIVTDNLKDFPAEYLKGFGLKAQSADDFLADMIDLNPSVAVRAFKELVLNRNKPDLNEFEILDQYRNIGLNQTADYLHSQL